MPDRRRHVSMLNHCQWQTSSALLRERVKDVRESSKELYNLTSENAFPDRPVS